MTRTPFRVSKLSNEYVVLWATAVALVRASALRKSGTRAARGNFVMVSFMNSVSNSRRWVVQGLMQSAAPNEAGDMIAKRFKNCQTF